MAPTSARCLGGEATRSDQFDDRQFKQFNPVLRTQTSGDVCATGRSVLLSSIGTARKAGHERALRKLPSLTLRATGRKVAQTSARCLAGEARRRLLQTVAAVS